MIEELHV